MTRDELRQLRMDFLRDCPQANRVQALQMSDTEIILVAYAQNPPRERVAFRGHEIQWHISMPPTIANLGNYDWWTY